MEARKTVVFLMVILISIGTLTFISIPKDAEPDIDVPFIYVSVILPGISPEASERLLGRPYSVTGKVIKGDQRGRTIGFPTANIESSEYVEPAKGVYSVRAGVLSDGKTKWLNGVANFGDRPTVEGTRLLLETHLFDFEEDLYGKNLRVALVEHLRPERKFENFEALKDQIKLDCETARKSLENKSLNKNE